MKTVVKLWHCTEEETKAMLDAGYQEDTEYQESPFLVARKIFEAGANVGVFHQRFVKKQKDGSISKEEEEKDIIMVGIADNFFGMK